MSFFSHYAHRLDMMSNPWCGLKSVAFLTTPRWRKVLLLCHFLVWLGTKMCNLERIDINKDIYRTREQFAIHQIITDLNTWTAFWLLTLTLLSFYKTDKYMKYCCKHLKAARINTNLLYTESSKKIQVTKSTDRVNRVKLQLSLHCSGVSGCPNLRPADPHL